MMSVQLGGGRGKPQTGPPTCDKCSGSLIGKQYLMQDSLKFCIECYESTYCNNCKICGELIKTDQQDITYKGMHFHDTCFTCAGCEKQLANVSFIYKDDRFTCAECYENKFSPKCATCNKTFKPGVKRMEYKGKSYHEKCFSCATCEEAIGQKSFVVIDDSIYCKDCYENEMAKKCAACKNVITTTGVVYKEENYHSECFVCFACQTNLAEVKFITHEDQPYCMECHANNFAKKCLRCDDPISGVGGAKMMMFEDMHWHFDCFKCSSCELQLEGQGFILSDDNLIYCTECEV